MPKSKRKRRSILIRGKRFRIIGFGMIGDIEKERGGRGGAQPLYSLAVYGKSGRYSRTDWFSPKARVAILEPVREQ